MGVKLASYGRRPSFEALYISILGNKQIFPWSRQHQTTHMIILGFTRKTKQNKQKLVWNLNTLPLPSDFLAMLPLVVMVTRSYGKWKSWTPYSQSCGVVLEAPALCWEGDGL